MARPAKHLNLNWPHDRLVVVTPTASTRPARMDASLRAHGVVVTRRTIQRRNIITSDAALPNHTALVPLGQHPTAALRDGDENAKTGYLTVIFYYRILFFDFVRVTVNLLCEGHEMGHDGIL